MVSFFSKLIHRGYSIVAGCCVEYNFSMLKSITRIILISIIFLGSSYYETNAAQSAEGGIYIPETGHWIRGEYLRMYQSADDPLLLFGYPITDEIIDPIDGQQTQYFEKVRFDLNNTDSGTYIEIAPLGDLMYTEGNDKVRLPTSSQACRYFASTNRYVCYAFEDFYETHNGEYYFGEPISNLEYVDGRYVQYFENCRLEWRPELSSGNRVALSRLGKQYFDTRLGDLNILNSNNNADLPVDVVQIQTHAFVANSLLPANSHQELFITVQDQNLNPISGAMVNVKIIFPNDRVESYRPGISNENGISTLKFEVGDLPVNEVVQVEVEVAYKGFQSDASTWFRIWW